MRSLFSSLACKLGLTRIFVEGFVGTIALMLDLSSIFGANENRDAPAIA